MTATLEIDWDEAVAATPELRINLRDYQQAARSSVQSGWAKYSRQLLDMATGTGKTSICSIMARDRWLHNGGRTLVLENRDALVRQTAKRLSNETGLEVDIEMAGEHASPFAPIVVASVQTLCRTARLTGFADDHFQQVIGDECFPAGTMIGSIPIELIRVGDYVESFNHKNLKMERRRVLWTKKSIPVKMVRVVHSNASVLCTECHPFFTQRGYVRAVELRNTDVIYERIQVRGVRDTNAEGRSLHRKKTSNMHALQKSKGEKNSVGVQVVQEACNMQRKVAILHEPFSGEHGQGVLLSDVRKFSVGSSPSRNCEKAGEVEFGPLARPDEKKQSNAKPKECAEDDSCAQGKDIPGSRRERSEYETADCAIRSTGRSADGICDLHGGGRGTPSITSAFLQSRPSISRCKTGGRGRWENPQTEEMAFSGRPQNFGLEPSWVDRVEILERGSGCGYSEVCPDGFVYNFEVEGNNNYFANGILVHNCHHSLAKSWAKVFNYFHYGAESLVPDWKPPIDGSYKPKCDVLGVTATPELSSNRNLGEFYQTIAYRYQLLNAVKDGWLVMPRAIMEPLAINFKGLRATRTSHGSDYNPTEVAERMVPVIEALASRMAFHAADRKGMAFMPSVKTAEMLAEALNRNGLRAIFVSGECLDRDEKTDVFVEHDAAGLGQGIMLCTAALYTEGFDVPDVDFVFAGITKSRSYYRQKIGRATRPLKGTVDGLATAEERRAAIAASAKPNFLIYDPFCKCDEIELCDAYDLVTDRPEIKERMKAEGPLEEGSAEKAERDFIKSLEKEAKKHAAKKARTVDPLAWAVSLGDSAISSYTPKDDWESHPASVGQLDLIKRFGFNIEGVKTKGIASRIIARLNARASMHLATPKQLHLMHQLGLDEQTCATLTQAEATATIDRMLAAKRERGALVPTVA